MFRKIENAMSALLVAFLATLPFIVKFFQGILHIQIPSADTAIMQFVFLFACIAGIITWQNERHLSLASLLTKLPEKLQKPFSAAQTAAVTAILISLFINSLCQLVNPMQFSTSFWHIPIRGIFAFLPLCYVSMLIMTGAKKHALFPTLAGVIIGALISMGPFTGILYYVFQIEKVPILYKLNELWISFSSISLWVFLAVFMLFAFLGVPLFLVMAGISYILFSKSGGYVDVIPMETYRILTDRNIAAIPLFTIGGYILSKSSAGTRYVSLFKSFFGSFRGGTVIAAVIVSTFFSTFTGVSGVTILALGSLLSAVLVGSGYGEDNAHSLVTASGAIGLLFPPSAAIIMYGTVNYFSLDVFDLFKGAIIPGLIMMIAMIATGIMLDKTKVRPPFVLGNALRAFGACIPELLMPVFICVLYFNGALDLFEASAFAVLYAFVLTVFVRKDFTIPKAFAVIAESIPISGGVLFILGAASGVSYFMLDANVPAVLASFIARHVQNKYVFLILMNIVLLIVGCLMDMFSAILIVSPLLLPIAESFGISAVQAGVIFLMNLSIGFLTPPVGMDLFIASYTFEKPLSRIIKGILPFLLVQFAVLLLVTYVPFFITALV